MASRRLTDDEGNEVDSDEETWVWINYCLRYGLWLGGADWSIYAQRLPPRHPQGAGVL
jgi:hypothetical protein